MTDFSSYNPELGLGFKIHPKNIIGGLLGLPSIGNIWYVNATNGSNTSYKVNDPAQPLATVAAALSAATADQDDVIVVTGSSSTGRTTETGVVTWNKRRTHLLGNGAGRRINPRQGVGVYASDTASAFVISAANCVFSNLSFAAFGDTDIMVEITGNYNTFNNVHFQGIANTTAAGETGARAVLITAAGELEFNNCTFGVDTVTRTAVNATVEQTGSACERNKYINCDFLIFTSDAGAVHFKADTGNCYERYCLFDNCRFLNADTASSTTLTTVMDLSTTGNGTVLIKDSYSKGATDWANNFNNVFLTMPLTDTDEGGLTKIAT